VVRIDSLRHPGAMERVERLVVHVQEALRLASQPLDSYQRLALMLLDAAAELMMQRTCDELLHWEEFDFERCRPPPVGLGRTGHPASRAYGCERDDPEPLILVLAQSTQPGHRFASVPPVFITMPKAWSTRPLIASPERCLRAMADFEAEIAVFDLTDRERRRLRAMLGDPGMSANCMLYRVNRMVPILEVLPRTWRLLGSAAKTELHAFWRSFPEAMPQYADEARRFGVWLEGRIGSHVSTCSTPNWPPTKASSGRHSHGESPPTLREADGKPVGEEARPVARLLRRSPNGVDFVILVEMVGPSLRHPRIVNRLLDLQIGAISQVADVNDGHQDLRVVTEIHPLALFVDGLSPHDERSPRAVGLDTEELVDNGHRLTPLSRGLREVHPTGESRVEGSASYRAGFAHRARRR
jgi:hypothetical protein